MLPLWGNNTCTQAVFVGDWAEYGIHLTHAHTETHTLARTRAHTRTHAHTQHAYAYAHAHTLYTYIMERDLTILQ